MTSVGTPSNGKLISDLMSQLVAVIHSSTPYYSFCTCFS